MFTEGGDTFSGSVGKLEAKSGNFLATGKSSAEVALEEARYDSAAEADVPMLESADTCERAVKDPGDSGCESALILSNIRFRCKGFAPAALRRSSIA